jgi:hypothetical protein
MNEDLLEVVRIEHHLWKTCPCSTCEEERERRDHSNHPIHNLSVEAAHALGFLHSRCPEGSLARQIAAREAPK